jgi:hypothetical protein
VKAMFSRIQYRFRYEPARMPDSWFCAMVIITRSTNRTVVASRSFPAERFDRPEEAIRHAIQWGNGYREDGPGREPTGGIVEWRWRCAVSPALPAAFRPALR